jgi:NADH/NAD ratio-sensing transcriptional regulator Rex
LTLFSVFGIAAFDIREELGSDSRFDIPILPNYLMKSFVAEHSVKLAILTVPGSSAKR